MKYKNTLSLECPYCDTKTQFISNENYVSFCVTENYFHDIFKCTNCGGLILTKWDKNSVNIDYGNIQSFKSYAKNNSILKKYFPVVGDYKPQVNLQKIKNELVRKDYQEAIDTYNNGFYNASMVMSRRAIHQEVESKNAEGKNLFEKINSLVTSENLKKLLNKVKNFGNSGAHPDFFLYDNDGNILIPEENEKEFAKLALTFLDKYFQDQYEMEDLIANAPDSEVEIKNK